MDEERERKMNRGKCLEYLLNDKTCNQVMRARIKKENEEKDTKGNGQET